ncbi:PilZ domain-containing protein [Pseudoalteromonas shioyasakiensis]|uniref:PilZ domain-containing protein n=1 Tax=Pseudoalteromonas TaxID=53246 RepID=UPI0015B7ED5B|nr:MULTISPECIES: PilZ domain-containing protein [Pseudoalteromonas]MCG9707329.1 PilZ domain-containing protein [Pseudoalteromonas sp. Isolate3]MCP4587248.1 PilZ domain-containing protein [Pseudoalteromonas sp.]MCQ8880955.1 PilZ domain-containing protein [Pseudoalteromonas shioyasakiensis]QLE10157.1 PilZ domain-containing protein [Pseudoalteromonas shioyasakiensis]
MAEDILLKYESLVDELKAHLGTPQFDKLFKSKTASLTKPEQFLIKMEMSRLSQPVARFIDLRGQVTGQVKPYEYDGKQHFMDDTAIEVFEDAIKRHGGYTLAVYEAVMNTENNHRVMQKKAAEQALTDDSTAAEQPAKVIKFASYESRREERMNYSIKITVELDKDRKVAASTSDISLSGAKIKLGPRYSVKKGQLIGLRLVGLEQDFELGLKNGIQYEVVAVEKVSREYNHVRLKRTFIENNEKFDEFLESFIHGNKRRYKVNLDNTLDAVVSKGYEQYYIPRVTSFYAFLSLQGDKLYPSLALTTENNIFIQRYFCDERKLSCLYSIINQQRLGHLLSSPDAVKEEYLYTFTHTAAGKIYYYSATKTELESQPHLRDLFLGFGSQKDSWQCFKLQLMPSHPEDSYIPLSLPSSAGKNIEKLNKPPTPRVQGLIKDVKYLLILTSVGTKFEQRTYQQLDYSKDAVNQLKLFGHSKHKTPPHLEPVALEYVNLRAHKRYLYKTAVSIEHHEQTITGHTRDLSVMGLQIECDQPVEFKKGDIIKLNLPDLQKITKKHDLTNLAYEVMAVSKSLTTVNLKVHRIGDLPHMAIKFFTVLIDNNKDKLRVCEETPKIPGLSTALRNMVTKSVCQFPFYLHKEAAHFKAGAIGQGLYPSPLHVLLQNFALLNETTSIDGFLSTDQITEVITPLIKDRSRQDPPLPFTLFLRFDPRQAEISDAITSRCISEDDYKPQTLFVKKALKNDLVFVFRLYVSRTGRPDIDYLANELKYISQYALHKAKDLEEALWAVAGVGDLIDITEEALTHFDIDQKLITEMSKRKATWLKRVI